jgi:transglutaminase-like putative cysteine protease
VSEACTLEVVHETRYAYAAPVTQADHLGHLEPLTDAHQALLEFDLDIEPRPTSRRVVSEAGGGRVVFFSLTQPHRSLAVRARSRVRVSPRFAGLQPARSPAWEPVAEALLYRSGRPFEPAVEFSLPSPYVPRLEAMRPWAAACFPPGLPVAEGAIALMHKLHREFSFETAATEVDTPLATAFAQRRGVCQDFAHVLIGALRMQGLAARYVSGYLLTRPPEGQPPLVGADASHAWVQVWCPATPGLPAEGGGWLDLDPTNDLVPGADHVRVAVGRDYGDVTPLRGVIHGGGRHLLTVSVDTRRLA